MSEWRGSNRLFNGWTGSRLVGPLPVDRSSVANKPALLGLLVGQREVTGLLCSLSPAKRRALPEMEKRYDGASMREMQRVKSKINMQNKWNTVINLVKIKPNWLINQTKQEAVNKLQRLKTSEADQKIQVSHNHPKEIQHRKWRYEWKSVHDEDWG